MSCFATFPNGQCSGHVGHTLSLMCKKMRKKANLPLETTVNELMRSPLPINGQIGLESNATMLS